MSIKQPARMIALLRQLEGMEDYPEGLATYYRG